MNTTGMMSYAVLSIWMKAMGWKMYLIDMYALCDLFNQGDKYSDKFDNGTTENSSQHIGNVTMS